MIISIFLGHNIIQMCRTLIGTSDPATSAPGTIRSDYAIFPGRKVIGGSDNPKEAQKQIDLWFTEQELVAWEPNTIEWTHGGN